MILLLGGTSESLAVADDLNAHHYSFVLSVTTDYGAELALKHAQNVCKQTLTPETFHHFFVENHIKVIVDATHPFARVISQTVIEAAKKEGIPYIRYERTGLLGQEEGLKLVRSTAEACQYLLKFQGNIYLSTGSKTAPDYAKQLDVSRLHVRVLPTERVMKLLTDAGYQANQINAIQGPFSVELNVELFKHAQAVAVVTKESGKQGGVQEKIQACRQLNIPCVVIKRPEISYPKKVTEIAALEKELEGLR